MAKKAAAKRVPTAKKAVSAKKHAGAAKKVAAPAKKATAPRGSSRPAASSAQRKTPAGAEPLTHRLDALLHTMRCITQHEDQLCTLLHDARRTGRINAALRRELQAILAELPAEEYTHDLHAVLEITEAA